jgi:hypothetical protein
VPAQSIATGPSIWPVRLGEDWQFRLWVVAGGPFQVGRSVLQPFWALLISAHNVSAHNVSAGGASSNLRAAVLPSSRLIVGRSTSDARAMCETSDT